MAEFTIRKADYDELVLDAVRKHRARPHQCLDTLGSLIEKLEGLGKPGPTDRCTRCGQKEASAMHRVDSESAEIRTAAHPFNPTPEHLVMANEEATLDLTAGEASLLHVVLRQGMRKVPAQRAVQLRYLTGPLETADREAAEGARVGQLSSRVAELKDEVLQLETQKRQLTQDVANLRALVARLEEGEEA